MWFIFIVQNQLLFFNWEFFELRHLFLRWTPCWIMHRARARNIFCISLWRSDVHAGGSGWGKNPMTALVASQVSITDLVIQFLTFFGMVKNVTFLGWWNRVKWPPMIGVIKMATNWITDRRFNSWGDVLQRIMDHHDSDTLVVGPVLDGHKFREGLLWTGWWV